jgi:hypothetical protein
MLLLMAALAACVSGKCIACLSNWLCRRRTTLHYQNYQAGYGQQQYGEFQLHGRQFPSFMPWMYAALAKRQCAFTQKGLAKQTIALKRQ